MIMIVGSDRSLASMFLHQILAQRFKEARQMPTNLVQLDLRVLQGIENLLNE